MIDPATLPAITRCVACSASVAVSWYPEPTPQGCYVSFGFCRSCGSVTFGLAHPGLGAREAFKREVLGPLAVLIA